MRTTKFLNYALKIGDLQNAKEKDKYQRQRDAAEDERKKAEDARKADEHKWAADKQPYVLTKAQKEAEKAGYDADTSKAKAEHAPELEEKKGKKMDAEIATEEERGRTERTKQENNRASAAAHNRQNPKEFVAYRKGRKGKMIPHYFTDKDAAERFAQLHGTWVDDYTVSYKQVQVTDRHGKPLTNADGTPKVRIEKVRTKSGGHPTDRVVNGGLGWGNQEGNNEGEGNW